MFSWPTNYESCYTLGGVISREGIGLHSGEKTRVTISPYEKEGYYVSFRDNPDKIFKEIGNSSIAIIEHRFSTPFKNLEINGKFCVEWNTFRRDKEGMKCLGSWKNQCLEWCYYKLEEGKMGDQKYLDNWPYTNINGNHQIRASIGATAKGVGW